MVVYFIDVLGIMKGQIEGVVFSFDVFIEKLKSFGIIVFDFNSVDCLGIYVDGVDEINGYMQMIKGGGVVLICEKIIVLVVDKFICIVDVFKQVDILGKFLLLVEVILMVCSVVVCQLVKLGGCLEYCQGVVIDNGNVIFDVYGLEIFDVIVLENVINGISGVVIVGLFVNCGVDVVLIGIVDGVKIIVKQFVCRELIGFFVNIFLSGVIW